MLHQSIGALVKRIHTGRERDREHRKEKKRKA